MYGCVPEVWMVASVLSSTCAVTLPRRPHRSPRLSRSPRTPANRRVPRTGGGCRSADGRGADAKAMLDRRPDSKLVTNADTRRLQLYRGEIGPEAVLTAADTGEVQVATLAYGLGNWYLLQRNKVQARTWFERSIESAAGPGSDSSCQRWSSDGFIEDGRSWRDADVVPVGQVISASTSGACRRRRRSAHRPRRPERRARRGSVG